MITFPTNGKLRYGAWNIDVEFKHNNNKIILYVRDTSKFPYEKGYAKRITRSLSKNKTIKLDGYLFDLSKVEGL